MKSINLGKDYNSIFSFDQFDWDKDSKKQTDELNMLN